MGIREKLNENPRITAGATAAIILVALGFIVYQAIGGGGPPIPTKAYYTIDDGETYFEDDIQKLAPFEHEGKQAVRAAVANASPTIRDWSGTAPSATTCSATRPLSRTRATRLARSSPVVTSEYVFATVSAVGAYSIRSVRKPSRLKSS